MRSNPHMQDTRPACQDTTIAPAPSVLRLPLLQYTTTLQAPSLTEPSTRKMQSRNPPGSSPLRRHLASTPSLTPVAVKNLLL